MKGLKIILVLSFLVIVGFAQAKIIPVPTPEYPTIQDGIDAAVDGDTVLVTDGTYTGEGNTNIRFDGKSITVKSENGPENCIIDCENAINGFGFGSGENENAILDGFTIVNGYAHDGAAIDCFNSSSPTIINNIIINNWANQGAGIDCKDNSSPTIINNIIAENSGGSGAGIYCVNGSSPMIANNIIADNSAIDGNGGGICCSDYSSPSIINNTITNNFAEYYGGGIGCYNNSSPTVLNTILWGNTPEQLDIGGPDSVIIITYSDIQGGGWPGEGNIDADPLFVDPDDGDYHLTDYSPCTGAGIMTPDVPAEDFEGDPRPNPTGSNPDMGADENPLAEPIPSINGYVTDCQTGEPIKWALVIALQKPDTRVRVFTKRDGYYEISDLEPGECWLICIKKGYKLYIAKVEIPNRHDFCMEPK